MDEEVRETENIQEAEPKREVPQKPSRRSSVLKKALLILLALVLIAGPAAGAYWWRDNEAKNFEKEQSDSIATYQAKIADLEEQIADANTDNTNLEDDEDLCVEIAPSATVIENIQASITSGNTAALEGYMASTVNVILAATEAYGPQTPTQAVSSISSFISDDNTSWDYDFALPVATLNAYYQGEYSQYFSNIDVVGKATNNKVISFSFDCNGKIDTVFLANNSELL